MSSHGPLTPSTYASEVMNRLAQFVSDAGFTHFGFAELTKPLSIEIYEEWLKSDCHGEMSYLERHLPDKREPQRLLAKARSAIVVTMNYVPHPEPIENWPLTSSTRVAAYARGRDYHHFLQSRLKSLIAVLEQNFPEESFLSFTDSGPVLERDLAARAGLGWVGKNTCLIDRKEGSLFFIAEIYTTIALPVASISINGFNDGFDDGFKTVSSDDLAPESQSKIGFCGTCTRCLDACPTGALTAPRKLDARLCISYLTIESRTVPDESLRRQIGDWLFGCDICQTVCPWNVKAHGADRLRELDPPTGEGARASLVKDLRFLLSSPNRAIERAFQGTAMARAGGVGLKRNALIVAANKGLTELQTDISTLTAHEKLGDLAQWALRQLEPSTKT